MRRHDDEPLRPGAIGEDGPDVDHRQAKQIAERIEGRDDIGLPVNHAPAIESWW
jgi:hypothetical protein